MSWIERVSPTPESVAAALESGTAAAGILPRAGERWAVKLNLTYPTYLPGVVNSPIFVEGMCRWASARSLRLQFIEGDGGNGSYSARDGFDGNGVTAIAERHGMTCASISEKPWEWRETSVAGRSVRLPYSPFFRRREYDKLITAPVFKNHIFTTVSLGMKNLWGCIPDAYRMYYHHVLDHGIVALHKELAPDCSIFDGIVSLRGAGPMDGSPVETNAVMVASDVGTGEAAALEVMGIPSSQVRHLEIARAEGLVPHSVQWLTDPAPFRRDDFVVRRTLLNHMTIRLGNYPRLQRLVYHSALSRGIYAVVDRLRPSSPQAALVEAKRMNRYGTIPIERR